MPLPPVCGALVFETVTVIDAVRVLPAASRATALTVCVPFAMLVVFHVVEYGDDVSSLPRLVPSTRNWTPATPTLSLAFAVTATEAPDTVALFAGAVRETVGSVVSGVGVGGGVVGGGSVGAGSVGG